MIYPDVLRKVKLLENSLIQEKIEHLYVFKSSGQQVIHSVGDEVRSTLLGTENVFLLDSIVTHNHPGKYGTSFSKNDIRMAVNGNVLQMRAVGMDRTWHPGKFFRYVLDRPVTCWPDIEQVEAFLEYVWVDTKQYLQKKVNADQMAADRATCILNHLCLKRFSKRFGVAYERYVGDLACESSMASI